MTIFGVMYRDDSHLLSESELINKTKEIFERKCGEEATLALLPIMPFPVPVIEGMLITRSHLVWPYHTIVGVALADDQVNPVQVFRQQ